MLRHKTNLLLTSDIRIYVAKSRTVNMLLISRKDCSDTVYSYRCKCTVVSDSHIACCVSPYK